MFQDQSVNNQDRIVEVIDMRAWRAAKAGQQRRAETVNRQILRRLHDLPQSVN